MKKTLKTIILLLALSILNACIPDFTLDEVDCSECYPDHPEEAELIVKFTKNTMNQTIPIVVFEGRLEQRDTFLLDTIRNSTEYIMVPVDRYYTVQAKYQTQTGIVYAIDGDEIKALKVTGQCSGTCWVIRGGILNNTLKYPDPKPQ